MADIVYQGLTFTQTPSGDWRVDTNFGSATGSTPAQAVLNASNSIAANNPNSTSIQTYADGIKEIALDPATNGGVTRAYRAADMPTVTSDTAANKTAETTPPAPTTELSTTETAKIDKTDAASAEQPAPTETSNNSEPTAAESPFGPNAKYYDFSKMTPEEIAATGTLGATSNPDAVTEFSTPITNPLHEYPSYTYGISLHMLTVDEYNKIVENQKFEPSRVIIASAGRWDGTTELKSGSFPRAQHFDVDFYFENLSIDTMIGLNDHSRATNAIDLSFNIIEPYGITLFNRILKLTHDINPENGNYLEQPYLLQIDFFAADELGQVVGEVPKQTKRIPIRFLKFDIKVSNKGAEYSIQASPYNHSAFDVSTLSTPAHFEVVAGSVISFFKSNEQEEDAISAQIDNQRELQSTMGIRVNDSNYNGLKGGVIGPDGQITYVNSSILSQETTSVLLANSTGDPVYRVKSYGSALNAWQRKLKSTNKIKYADVYKFKFDEEAFGDANFNLHNKLPPYLAPMVDPANSIAHRRGQGTAIEMMALDYKTKVTSVNMGTSIEQVINYVIRNSSYVQSQLVVPEDYGSDPTKYLEKKQSNASVPLLWFKIIPTVKLIPGSYDPIRRLWAREITYHVLPYYVYNTKISVAPQAIAKNKQAVKEYNYIYTGKNVDVLDLQIEFNAMYYTSLTAYRNNTSSTSGIPSNEETKENNPSGYASGTDGLNPDSVQPMKEKPETINARARATGGELTPISIAAVDVEQSLYSMSKGDMIQASIKIIGDPQYIKQDDVFYTPETTNTPHAEWQDPRLIADGSLHMDKGEVYIRVNYNSPSDIDETTGLMNFDTNYLRSVFSGMYRVLKVTSTFSGGQFLQNLEIIRLPRQKTAEGSAQLTNTERNVDNKEAAQISSAPVVQVDVTNNTNTAAAAVETESAPGSNPAPDQATSDKTATDTEGNKIAADIKDAPTEAITEKTAPVASPVDTGPSAEKLAVKAQMDALASQRSAWAEATNDLQTMTDALASKKERLARWTADPSQVPSQGLLVSLQNQVASLQAKADQDNATIAANRAAADQWDALQRQYSTMK